jgi:SPOR domain
MRALFLFLLLGNAAFYAWVNYLRAPQSARERIQQVEITPEKIRLLSTPATVAKKAATPVAQLKGAACVEWGAFIGPEAARGDAAIAELGLPAAQVRRVASDLDGHWVMIPPLRSRAAVERTTERLKELGVTDYSVVLEQPRRNAISLGIFRTEEAAQNLLANLQKRGVTEATVELREAFFRRVVFYVREPNDAMVARLSALKAAHPGTEVKAVACPAV